MPEQRMKLKGEYITLGQLLKWLGTVTTGGAVRDFLASSTILVNGEIENRRGRKLRPGDKISLPEDTHVLIVSDGDP